MGLNLIMKRKVYATIQVLCDTYEDKFEEKLATAKLVNVLLAEALITRNLIPEDFIETEYGSSDPLSHIFTAKARNEKTKPLREVQHEQIELEKKQRMFGMVVDQWADHPDKIWREKWFKEAEKWQEKVSTAKLVLALKIGDKKT